MRRAVCRWDLHSNSVGPWIHCLGRDLNSQVLKHKELGIFTHPCCNMDSERSLSKATGRESWPPRWSWIICWDIRRRAPILHSMVDGSSHVMKSCPTRKKTTLSVKECFFFIPTIVEIFLSHLQHCTETPHPDSSTVEYYTGALSVFEM